MATGTTATRSLVGMLAAVVAAGGLIAVTVAVAPEDRSSSVAQAAADPATRPASVEIGGSVVQRGVVDTAAMKSYQQHTVAATYLTSKGEQRHTYTGPLLLDILLAAEPRFDPADRHDELRFGILVRATDGYEALLAWGEISPELANTEVLLATTEDGKVLDIPKLVTPSDSHGARYVFDVASITLVRIDSAIADGPAGNVITVPTKAPENAAPAHNADTAASHAPDAH